MIIISKDLKYSTLFKHRYIHFFKSYFKVNLVSMIPTPKPCDSKKKYHSKL